MTVKLKFEMMRYPKLERLTLGRFETVDRVRVFLMTSNGVEFTIHMGELMKDITGHGLYFITGLPWVAASQTIEGLISNLNATFILNEDKNIMYVPKRAGRYIVKTLAEKVDFNVLHLKNTVSIELLNID